MALEATRCAWHVALKEALEFDSWGQVEEAVFSYQRLQVATSREAGENRLNLVGGRAAAIGQLSAALKLRIQELQGGLAHVHAPPHAPGIGVAGMQALRPFVAGLIVSDVPCPPAVAAAIRSAGLSGAATGPQPTQQQQQQQQQQPHAAPAQQDAEDAVATPIHKQRGGADPSTKESGHQPPPPAELHSSTAGARAGATTAAAAEAAVQEGTLRPAPQQVSPGDVTLSVSCGSWSVKGADAMVRPHVAITVRDAAGELLEAVQASPVVAAARSGHPDKLDLDFDWHLQTPLNSLPEDAAVFFELRHWKPAKKKWSVRCYAFLLLGDDCRRGAAQLQLYKKPTNFKQRGRHPALTSKPMFLHITRTLQQH